MPGEGYRTTAFRAIANRGRPVRTATVKRSSPLAKRNTTRKRVKAPLPRVSVTPKVHSKHVTSLHVQDDTGESAHLYRNRRNGMNFRNILNDNPRLSESARKLLTALRRSRNAGDKITPAILESVRNGILEELAPAAVKK